MSNTILLLPSPRLESNFQPGVTDPVWSSNPPAGVDPGIYCDAYGGQLSRQRHLHIVTANVTAKTVGELKDVMRKLADFAHYQMRKTPFFVTSRPYDPPIENRRVTVTVGYGATLFTTSQGDDRFGLAHVKPSWLKIIPPIQGDGPSFSPRAHATDFIFLLASDVRS